MSRVMNGAASGVTAPDGTAPDGTARLAGGAVVRT